MKHLDSLFNEEQQAAPETITLSNLVVAQSVQLPTVYANYYGAPNIAANSILDMQMPLTVTALPEGGFAVDLSGLFSMLANYEKPDNLSDFMSQMFDYALDHPVVTLIGDLDGIQLIGAPGSWH